VVFTTDTLTEDVHFRSAWLEAPDLGYKAVVQSLSDLAAMGAAPLGFVVALSLPASAPESWVAGFLDGLKEAGGRWDCPLVGGNLSRAPGARTSVTVSMLGTLRPDAGLLRTRVRPGEAVALTGWPGLAYAGLRGLEDGAEAPAAGLAQFRRPSPRLAEACFLRDRLGVRAALDTSDCLAESFDLLCRASGVRLTADAAALPVHPEVREEALRRSENPLAWALYGGEDFELLFTAPAEAAAEAAEEFQSTFGVPLTVVGKVGRGEGLEIKGAPPGRGFNHFPPDVEGSGPDER
jgi:thiamine-monophosphate kinase